MVQGGREKEGGGVRVVLPSHHSRDLSKGRFLPEGGVSSVLGHPEPVCAHDSAFRRRQCWEHMALHVSVKGSIPRELQRHKHRHYCLCHKPLMILINI